MGTFSIWHWLIVLAVVLVLFGGGGKIPRLMGDVAKGIKSFKAGLKDEDKANEGTAQRVELEGGQDQANVKSGDGAAKS